MDTIKEKSLIQQGYRVCLGVSKTPRITVCSPDTGVFYLHNFIIIRLKTLGTFVLLLLNKILYLLLQKKRKKDRHFTI
jgi:hypothetical protein